MFHVTVLFAGGIATLRCVAIQIRLLWSFLGCVYGCSGLVDMLLNHNNYIKAKNVCSAQCSILHVYRDIIDLTSLRRRINDHRMQPKHRPAISDRPSSSPTATARHERRLKCPLPLAHCRPYVHRNWIFFQSRQRSRPNNRTKLLSDIRDAPTTRSHILLCLAHTVVWQYIAQNEFN